MNEQLQLIREKCIATNPEIMDLGFGCKVRSKDTKLIYPVTYSDDSFVRVTDFKDPILHDFGHEDVEILGRPIRLADVLLAVYKDFHAEPLAGSELKVYFYRSRQQSFRWNLRADDLEKQSQETITFLYELLK